jgi:ABC-type lipoprotein release transport system permease subunit
MNPLNPFTYYRRHKGQALLLLVLVGSLTLGVFVMVGIMSTAVGSVLHQFHHLTRVSRMLAGEALDPGSVAQIRAHPGVAAVVPENGLTIAFPSWGGLHARPVLGVMEDDLQHVMEACDLRLKEGRMIGPRSAEIMLSEEIVDALDLHIGDQIGHEVHQDYYASITTELTLVGILESIPSETGPDIQVGIASYEYLAGHEAYQPRLFNLLIIPRQDSRTEVDRFVQTLIDGSGGAASVRLETFDGEADRWLQVGRIVSAMHVLADVVVAASAALAVGMVNRIAVARRLPELGVLHAVGHQKPRLVRRLVLETVAMVGIAWGGGLMISVALSLLLNATPLAAGGPAVDLASPAPFLFTLAIPIAVIGWVGISVRRVMNRLDTIAIVERGKLSMEDTTKGRGEARSRLRPLSSWLFFLRHRRRGLALLLTTGLMVLGVAFPPFVITMMVDSSWPLQVSYSSHASIVSPRDTYQAVNADVLAQIRGHPGVAHVIPARALSMVANASQPTSLPVYAVREGDLQALLDLYGMTIGEGELMKPGADQVVLTRALAQNRGLGVGDTIGRPVNEMDGMPTTMTVSGLLDSTTPGLVERAGYRVPATPRWAGFASYEFVERHERYTAAPLHALVVPAKGREAEVEAWLEENIVSSRVAVQTFGTSYSALKDFSRFTMGFLALTESILALVAAGALAILNYLFVTQRRDEFGVLYAVGHSRAGLIGRTLRESAGIAGGAWGVGAACCLALVLGAQIGVFAPRGMSLDLFNPLPWLFTLPIPLAVVMASASTISWALSRLDPVAVIERR